MVASAMFHSLNAQLRHALHPLWPKRATNWMQLPSLAPDRPCDRSYGLHPKAAQLKHRKFRNVLYWLTPDVRVQIGLSAVMFRKWALKGVRGCPTGCFFQ